jgi:hypothetical protein
MLDSLVLSAPAAEVLKSAEGKSASQKNPRDVRASSSAFAYAQEDLRIRLESKDGDVLEVRRTITVAAGYTRTGSRNEDSVDPWSGCAGNEACAPGTEEAGEARQGGLAGAMDWVREITRELEQQQAKLLESLLKGHEYEGEGEDRFVSFSLRMISIEAGFAAGGAEEISGKDEDYGVPAFWNAENTSDRIVAFATSFAGIFGDDPEFAETIIGAVADGFSQASEILGNLPGKAGKLNRDTKDLVFAKLDNWLEAWRAGEYNQGAQSQAIEPTLTV